MQFFHCREQGVFLALHFEELAKRQDADLSDLLERYTDAREAKEMRRATMADFA